MLGVYGFVRPAWRRSSASGAGAATAAAAARSARRRWPGSARAKTMSYLNEPGKLVEERSWWRRVLRVEVPVVLAPLHAALREVADQLRMPQCHNRTKLSTQTTVVAATTSSSGSARVNEKVSWQATAERIHEDSAADSAQARRPAARAARASAAAARAAGAPVAATSPRSSVHDGAGMRLTLALLGYYTLVTLVITLGPFEFAGRRSTWTSDSRSST